MSVEELYHFELSPNGEETRFMGGCILTAMGISTATLCTAVESVVKNSENVKPWLLTLAAIRCSDYYYEEYQKYTEDPKSTDIFDKLFKEHPEIPATLKVSCDAKLLSIERGTRLFPGCDLSSNVVNNQEITISVGPTASNPEAVENTFEKLYKQPTGKDYLKGSVNLVVPRYLKQMKFFVKAHQNTPATMNLSELLRQIALLIIAESKDETVPRPGTRTSFDNVRGKLVADEWSTVDIVRLLDSALLRRLVKEYRRVCVHTVPDRNFTRPIIVAMMYQRIGANEGPINPTEFDHLLAEAAEDYNIRPAHDDAAMNDVAPQQRIAPQPTAPHHGTQPSDTGIDRAENANATLQHDARQPDIAALAAGAVDTINQRPPSAINDNEGDFDDMVDQFAEDFVPHLLDDDVATNLEQNPGVGPNPAATQGTISDRPNQVNSDDSIVEIGFQATNSGRKHDADKAQLDSQESSIHITNPLRQLISDTNARSQAMFESVREFTDKLDERIGTMVDAKISASLLALQARGTEAGPWCDTRDRGNSRAAHGRHTPSASSSRAHRGTARRTRDRSQGTNRAGTTRGVSITDPAHIRAIERVVRRYLNEEDARTAAHRQRNRRRRAH